jgi:hypothetical protein
MQVQVTQFYLPNGERRTHTVTVSDDCAAGYAALRHKGCRLTAEMLMTGAISQTIEHEEGDVLMEITFKPEDTIPALEKMLREFNDNIFDQWLVEISSEETAKE